MQLLEVSDAVRLIYKSLGVKGLMSTRFYIVYNCKYWDPSILTAPWTYLTGGLMMAC